MPSVSFSLPDVVVVTGAASGLGQDIAELLLENGVRVIGVDLATSALSGRDNFTQISGSVADDATWKNVLAEIGTPGWARLGSSRRRQFSTPAS